MKSLLCFRPNHHQIDNRIEGHLFICVLAYHLINIIYNKLKKVDIHYSWEHILKCLNKQVRITTSLANKDSEIINIRNCSEPTDFQNEIYSALKIKNIPLAKAVVKRKK